MSRLISLTAGLALCLVAGCVPTTRKVTLRSELAQPARTGPIYVYTKAHREIRLQTYVLADSVLRGEGSITTGFTSREFDGEVPFDSIEAIGAPSRSGLKGVLGFAAVFGFATMSIMNQGNEEREKGLDERITSGSSGGGSSCPYVYAWNGSRYVLEAEPFGVGFGRALELTTHHLLPSERAENGIVRLRLTNERLETHSVNSIRAYAIDLGDVPEAALDADGRAWPVRLREAPVAAGDDGGRGPRSTAAIAEGRDRGLLAAISAVDGEMWECPVSDLSPGSSYEDRLEVAFARPPGAREGTLILTGINTEFSSVVFQQLSLAAGDQALALAHAIDSDPERIVRLREYLADAVLKVAVLDGERWEDAGAFRPEANAVGFTRALRLHVPASAGDTVRVRLRAMADVWKIDALAADWSDARPLPAQEVELLSAIGPDGEDLRSQLAADDDRHAVLLPPDQVELRFAAPGAGIGVGASEVAAGAANGELLGSRIVYAVAGRGYLHEWAATGTPSGAALLASRIAGEQRIEFIKTALEDRAMVLEAAYAEWARARR